MIKKMDSLPDNIFLHQIFPFIDFVLDLDILSILRINKKFYLLIKKYFLILIPNSFNINYLNEKLEEGKILKDIFEYEISGCLTLVNKVTHGELIDYLSQSNQNKIDRNVLKGLNIIKKLVGYKENKKIVSKSKTEQKKKRIYHYLEFLQDY